MERRFVVLRSVLAVSLCMMLPSVALAADWDAYNSDDVYDAYANDTDATVNIFMMDNIAMDSTLYGNAGQVYTINGNGYVISDLVLSGAGSTTVNADVGDSDDEDEYSLDVYSEADVTVNGDITGSVYADGESVLTINGNVTGIDAVNDVDMDDYRDYSDPYPRNAVYGTDNTVIVINGDVTGADGYGAYSWAQDGVDADRSANITVNGNVTGGNVIGKETVGEEDWESMGGDGIQQFGYSASITVNGNVTGGNTNTRLGQAGAGIVLSKGYGYYPVGVSLAPGEVGSVTVTGIVKGGLATGEDGVSGAAVAFYGYDEGYNYDSVEPSDIDSGDLVQLTVLKLEPSEEGAPLFGTHFDSDYEFTPEELQAMADKTLYIVAPTASNGTVASNIDNALAGDTVTLTPTAEEGYVLKSLLVNGVELFSENGVFSFVMPEGGALITAQFEPSTTTKASLTTGTTIPQTGDDSNTALMILAGIGSLCLIAGGYALYRSRKQYRPLHS